ncbi:unnamed protein product [Prorocentrum cordatum]|uniref:Uncharacterized protein n=1 Tax=Prorocentrum cordatum TaxID=2364126 RepID=A0ABN9RPW3_9DINO|nr:unnamed protein product [Polarella glacialis]
MAIRARVAWLMEQAAAERPVKVRISMIAAGLRLHIAVMPIFEPASLWDELAQALLQQVLAIEAQYAVVGHGHHHYGALAGARAPPSCCGLDVLSLMTLRRDTVAETTTTSMTAIRTQKINDPRRHDIGCSGDDPGVYLL